MGTRFLASAHDPDPECRQHMRGQWQILIQKSGLAEGYTMRYCTFPLDLTSESRFGSDAAGGGGLRGDFVEQSLRRKEQFTFNSQ